MIKNGKVTGLPLVQYKDTQANIEALSGVEVGSEAYATDTLKSGTYNGTTWDWGASGSYLPLTGGTLSGDLSVPEEAYDATAWNGSLEVPTKNALRDKIETLTGVTDGDKGDVTVSSSGSIWTIDNNAVTFEKMQAITDGKLLGASGGTAVEEISVGSALSLSGNTLDAVTTIDTHKVSKLRESDDGADALTADASGQLVASSNLYVLTGATFLRQLIGQKNDSMADDTAVVMPIMATGNRYLFGIVCNDGEYFFGVNTYNSIATIAASANFNIVASDGAALLGNAGTDGKWNIKDWNGALYLNNRRGGTQNAGFTAFGSD